MLDFVEYLLQLLYFLLGGCPGGDEATDGVMVVGLTEMGERDVLGKTTGQIVGKNDELLVGGGIDVEGKALTKK